MGQRKRFAEKLADLAAARNLKHHHALLQIHNNIQQQQLQTQPQPQLLYPYSLSPSGDSAVDLIYDGNAADSFALGISRFECLSETLRHLDFGFRPNTPVGMPANSEPNTPPNTPFPSAAATTSSMMLSMIDPHFDYPMNLHNIPFYGNQWDHRFIAEELILILQSCPNLRSLNLSGCQIKLECVDTVVDAFRALPFGIQFLDLSSSSLKGWALVGIVAACGESLKVLNISGLFRFRRNNGGILHKIIEACPRLERLIAKQCPDIDQDLFMDVSLMTPNLKFVRDRRVSRGLGVASGDNHGLLRNATNNMVAASLASSSSTSSVSTSSSSSSISSSLDSSATTSPAPIAGRLDRVATIDEE
ncbi:UNVERIFIED_CONTAM: hypothetical protein HDU68_001762 [Siphonaria sp. JEL0065]|nr:hypothetical protein HDU68_001762 [Siphonaria sp. JEL0065]